MLGLAFSKALIAVWVAWPSVPRPDSANTIVCLALAATGLAPPELPHAASPSAVAASATAGTSARRRRCIPARFRPVLPGECCMCPSPYSQ